MPLSLVVLILVLLLMLAELRLSRANERALRGAGAVEPPQEVYDHMRWAYPGAFAAMAVEGAIRGLEPGMVTAAGAAVFVVAKLLKGWAIASLGPRWTYRVLVLPGVPLVTHGPYRFMRHPNYVGVAGELVGMALLVGAVVTGPLSIVGFGALLRRRIRVEERALSTAAESGAQSSGL
jgi:methyltransferase